MRWLYWFGCLFFVVGCTHSPIDRKHSSEGPVRTGTMASVQSLAQSCTDTAIQKRGLLAVSDRTTLPLSEVKSLAEIAPKLLPWEAMAANSERRHSMYVGATPRELLLYGKKESTYLFPEALQEQGNRLSKKLLKALGLKTAEFEAWPTWNDEGDPSWVFARYRKTPLSNWQWIDSDLKIEDDHLFLPKNLDPEKESVTLFAPSFEQPGLYDKPIAGDAIWTTPDGSALYAAWDVEKGRKVVESTKEVVAKIVPPPAVFNKEYVTFHLGAHGQGITWPKEIRWTAPVPQEADEIPKSAIPDIAFPATFEKLYEDDMRILSGEKKGHDTPSKFIRKSAADPQNQLLQLAQYLKKRHEANGHQVEIQNFIHKEMTEKPDAKGIPVANVIVKIPGTLKGASNRPVIVADHIDTAYAEDVFIRSKERVSVPGANDNVSASAALLRMSDTFKGAKPLHDIWLVHFTGEEYPPDCLGAREFLKRTLRDKVDFQGMFLMDMIAFRRNKNPTVQINPGNSKMSNHMANIGLSAIKKYAPDLKPVIRPRLGTYSYLYNTDGYPTDQVGYDVAFFNEAINRHNIGSYDEHYHKSHDTVDNADVPYAASIVKAVTASAMYLANKP